jgi:Tol biopolymer transport system component/DNA-binding winged helix-turn-helix (wHTH) protein
MTSIYPQRVRFGPFEADLETHELWKNGIKVKLGGQPFEILALLLKRPGQMVSRDELQKEIWAADTFVDFNHGLNAAVNKLRETLSDSAEDPKYIETLPRRGYRFVGKIENAVNALAETAPASQLRPEEMLVARPPVVEAQRTPQAVAPVGTPPPKTRRWLIWAAALIAGVLLVTGVQILHRYAGPEVNEAAGKLAEARTLSNMLTLVPDPASDPAISPDGNSVAFRRNSYTPGAAGIFVTKSDGKSLTQLTQHPGDCCPAWSPDGKTIAYSRISTDEYGIYVVNETGGAPRKISHEDPRKKRGELAWSADGKFIAFSGDSPQGGSQIFLLSVADSSVQALTEPQGQERDWGPSFSPDGTRMAFVRANGAGFPEEIFVIPMAGAGKRMVEITTGNGKKPPEAVYVASGAVEQVTNQRAAIMGPPAWSPDGQSIIFSSTKAGEPSLWRTPANGGNATPIEEAGAAAWHPTVSTKDGKLVVQKILRSSGIYRVELREGGTQRTKTIVTSTNGRNEGPLLSPDGKRLLFMSDRSGGLEIWVSNRDGSSPMQLTNLHGCGTPRWSPDGQWVVFDAGGAAAQGIYVVSAFGGAPRALLTDGFENSVPNWSRDGQWIYFGSNRSGKDQLWKVRASGGHAVQVTTNGGFSGWESADRKTIYYAKSRYENPEIWQVPVAGGTEQIVSTTIRPKSWAAWAVTGEGVYFCPNAEGGTAPSVDFYDFQTHLTRQLTLLEKSPFWLSVSADGREMFYDLAGQDESSILLVQSYK